MTKGAPAKAKGAKSTKKPQKMKRANSRKEKKFPRPGTSEAPTLVALYQRIREKEAARKAAKIAQVPVLLNESEAGRSPAEEEHASAGNAEQPDAGIAAETSMDGEQEQ
ncbi:unnamed protein product [Amoebophrya sp. A25]|nr:unnamed protein product [Amoebophrya sp. A25]|eukprot:GSA25T00006502001.1